jgi:hypothetical protein
MNYERQLSALTVASNDLLLLVNYTLRESLLTLQLEVENAELNLASVRAANEARRLREGAELRSIEAEFALAREQLGTQTPAVVIPLDDHVAPASRDAVAKTLPTLSKSDDKNGSNNASPEQSEKLPAPLVAGDAEAAPLPPATPTLPADWPDPRGFIPPPPSLTRPAAQSQSEPVLTHTRVYHGNDPDLTMKLEKYYYFRDDARFGGWQSYLQRSEDFTRFCCHLHITEMLAARGGVGKPRVVYRWPISRYDR